MTEGVLGTAGAGIPSLYRRLGWHGGLGSGSGGQAAGELTPAGGHEALRRQDARNVACSWHVYVLTCTFSCAYAHMYMKT